MKKILLIILITLGTRCIFSQGIFTRKGNFSVDAGVGYTINDDFNGMSYNLSTSLLGFVDLGFNYFKAFPSNTFKRAEGNIGYLDFYVKKDSLYGVVLNIAFSTINYESALLVGLSFYGKLDFTNRFPFNFAPYLSLGYLTTEDIVAGFGLAIQKKTNKNFSVVLTPAVNASTENQIVLGFEFIYQ